jgi:hypothetical protein
MKKSILFFSIILFSIFINESCNPCKGTDSIDYNTIAITGNANFITGIETSSDEKFFNINPFEGDTFKVRYDSLAITVVPEFEFSYNKQDINFTFGITKVMACSPAVNYDVIFDVIIKSDKDYNSAYPAGSNLTSLMAVHFNRLVRPNNIDEALIGRNLYDESLFTFTQPPSDTSVRSITIKYILTNGLEFSTTVKGIKIMQ